MCLDEKKREINQDTKMKEMRTKDENTHPLSSCNLGNSHIQDGENYGNVEDTSCTRILLKKIICQTQTHV
jgi:hypothetical protein